MTPEQLVAKVFGHKVTEIDDATSPDTIVEWDSLGHVTLIIELEAAYGISLGPEESLKMIDVAAIKLALHEHGATW
jgi:acyl carrier protein